LNDSCTIEVQATRQGSLVRNVLKLALEKIKANENPNEYCLIEHIEQEKTILKQDSINSITYNPIATTTTAATLRTRYPNSNNASSNMQKRVSVVRTTRMLESNENLFLLTHVWNQLKTESKDGFKGVKIMLTKTSTKSDINSNNDTNSYKSKRASLLKHRFSLQPQSSHGFNLIESLKQTNNLIINRTSNNIQDMISKVPSPLLHDTTTTTTTSNKSLAVNRKRTKSSLNRLVRQKSFDESTEIDENINNNNLSVKISNMYPSSIVRESSHENYEIKKKKNNLSSDDDEEEEDSKVIFKNYRDKKIKNSSLTSSNKTTDDLTDQTTELTNTNSGKNESTINNNDKNNKTNFAASFDDYDDLNEVSYDYHEDYYDFGDKSAPLASDSIISSNENYSQTESGSSSNSNKLNLNVNKQQTKLHRLFKFK